MVSLQHSTCKYNIVHTTGKDMCNNKHLQKSMRQSDGRLVHKNIEHDTHTHDYEYTLCQLDLYCSTASTAATCTFLCLESGGRPSLAWTDAVSELTVLKAVVFLSHGWMTNTTQALDKRALRHCQTTVWAIHHGAVHGQHMSGGAVANKMLQKSMLVLNTVN